MWAREKFCFYWWFYHVFCLFVFMTLKIFAFHFFYISCWFFLSEENKLSEEESKLVNVIFYHFDGFYNKIYNAFPTEAAPRQRTAAPRHRTDPLSHRNSVICNHKATHCIAVFVLLNFSWYYCNKSSSAASSPICICLLTNTG